MLISVEKVDILTVLIVAVEVVVGIMEVVVVVTVNMSSRCSFISGHTAA